jgi:hypothetical protein
LEPDFSTLVAQALAPTLPQQLMIVALTGSGLLTMVGPISLTSPRDAPGDGAQEYPAIRRARHACLGGGPRG